MPVTVVVGGQFGSEGKGKVAFWLAREMNVAAAIRVGGPNSGHTVINSAGKPIVFQQLPTASLLSNIRCILPAGSYVKVDRLLKEIAIAGLSSDRLFVDPKAVVITDRDIMNEESGALGSSIGSTNSGTGSAVINRLSRTGTTIFAADIPLLGEYIKDTASILRGMLERRQRVIIEGTQGFGLSPMHSPHYPYVTSRDTTAAGFISEAGISPLDVDDIVMVLRAFPIRVSGNSGPLLGETSWSAVLGSSSKAAQEGERTSVTGKIRRVGVFDPTIVKKAILYNQPTRIILNHMDYVTSNTRDDKYAYDDMFVRCVETSIERSIDFVGTGRDALHIRSAQLRIPF